MIFICVECIRTVKSSVKSYYAGAMGKRRAGETDLEDQDPYKVRCPLNDLRIPRVPPEITHAHISEFLRLNPSTGFSCASPFIVTGPESTNTFFHRRCLPPGVFCASVLSNMYNSSILLIMFWSFACLELSHDIVPQGNLFAPLWG